MKSSKEEPPEKMKSENRLQSSHCQEEKVTCDENEVLGEPIRDELTLPKSD